MLSDVDRNSLKGVFFAASLSVGMDLIQEPAALQHVSAKALMLGFMIDFPGNLSREQ